MLYVPIHPAAARLVGNWIAPAQQTFVNGMVNFAACVGIAITYYVFGKLIDKFDWTGACFAAAPLLGVAGDLLGDLRANGAAIIGRELRKCHRLSAQPPCGATAAW